MAVDPLALYKGELDNEDITARLETVAKTTLVARAMGPARASAELLPCISEAVDACPDDELLEAFGAQLGELRDLVAAKADLVPLLETLCKADETVVREAAWISATAIGEAMDTAEINAAFWPMVKRMLSESWWTPKVSAAKLLPVAYPLLADEAKGELKATLMQLTKDEAPMVRRAVAANLGTLCAKLDPANAPNDIFPSFNKLAKDDQDSVRILLLGSCIEMCASQPEAQRTDFLLPSLQNLAKDASWRVRLEVAKAVGRIVIHVDDGGATAIQFCAQLLRDTEIDVQRFTLKQVPVVCSKFPEQAESSGILTAVAELADVDPEVQNAHQLKISLAETSLQLAELLGSAVADTHIIPLLVKLLQEEAVEIRIAVLEGWDTLLSVASGDVLIQALPLSLISTDSSWRVRRALLLGIATLVAKIDRAQFDANIKPLLHDLVSTDQIAAVRAASGTALAACEKCYGEQFATEVTVPLVTELAQSDSHFARIAALQCIKELATLGASGSVNGLADTVATLSKDSVPNVKFNAAWTAKAIAEAQLATGSHPSLKAAMTEMSSDTDTDVAHFAGDALKQF